jgi:acyl-CoA thioester hydrolase
MTHKFTASWRVRFDEVDMQGMVHHPQIVTYLEIARVEYWRETGISYKQLRELGYEFIIKNVNVEYKKPLLFEEMIEVKVGVKSLARASFVLGYEIYKENGELAVVAETGLVCAKVGVGKPTALPQSYIQKLKDN